MTDPVRGVTRGMRRFLHILRDRDEGRVTPHALKPHEKKILGLAEDGLIEIRITEKGRLLVPQRTVGEEPTGGGCDGDDEEERDESFGDGGTGSGRSVAS